MRLKKFFCLVFIFFSSFFIYSQSSEFITKLLTTEKATYGQVSYLIAVYQGFVPETASNIEAMNALYQEKQLLDRVEPNAPITYKDLSFFFARIWNVKGGLMFRITNGAPRYAFNQFKNDGIIPLKIDPCFYPSGIDVLNMYTVGDLKYTSKYKESKNDSSLVDSSELQIKR